MAKLMLGTQVVSPAIYSNSTKYGASVDSFLGNTDENGVLQISNYQTDLDFVGVTNFVNYCFSGINSSSSHSTTNPTVYCVGPFSNINVKSIKCDSVTVLSGQKSFCSSCQWSANINSVSFENLFYVSGREAFNSMCAHSSLSSYNFSKLQYISGSAAFAFFCYRNPQDTNVVDINFPSLVAIMVGYALNRFSPTNNTTTPLKVDLKRLAYVYPTGLYCAFWSDSPNTVPLIDVELPSAVRIAAGLSNSSATMYLCNIVKSIYLPKLIDFRFSSTTYTHVFDSCIKLTEIHFGKKHQTTIESDAGYATLWGRGAGNATLYFDLINEITCGGIKYYRNAPDDDDTNQKYNWCSGGIITVNGLNYERYPSGDVFTTSSNYTFPFAWKMVGGNTLMYTTEVNPLVNEACSNNANAPYYMINDDQYKITAVSGITSVYTDNKHTPAVGDNYYTKSGDTYTLAGQITAVD